MVRLTTVTLAAIALPLAIASHRWPSGYNRMSRRTSWGRSSLGDPISRQPTSSQFSRQTFSPSNQYSANKQYSANQIPQQQSYPPQKSKAKFSRQSSNPNSISYNSPNNPNWKRKRFPSYVDRCGSCKGEPSNQVCGSDGKTYENSCELENISCRKYWDIRVVSMGPCQSTCPGVEMGMFTGFGLSRASNNGYCNYDFFRCCKAARRRGLDDNTVRSCCQARADQCFAFVASKPWRSGITKYGK